MRITLCARSRILQLLEPGKLFRISAVGSISAGKHVDLVLNDEPRQNDVIICLEPKVVTDIQTATLLANQVIDYSFNTNEFIISNRGSE